MSVTGISYTNQECFLVDCNDQYLKSPINNKNSNDDAKKFITSKMQSKPKVLIVVTFIFGVSCVFALLLHTTNMWTKQYCRTSACKRSGYLPNISAQNLLSTMNRSVDPCEDFYEFACGNFYRLHPLSDYKTETDWFDIGSELLLNKISDYLKKNNTIDEPKSVHLARDLYRSCMDLPEIEAGDFTSIADILREVNLPVKPPMAEKSENFSLLSTIVLSKIVYNKDFFFAFSISMDPKNRTRYRLHLSKPTEEPALPVRYDDKILQLKSRHIVKEDVDEYAELDNEDIVKKNVDEYGEIDNEEVDEIFNTNVTLIYEEGFYEYALNVTEFVFNYLDIEWTSETDEIFNKSVKELMRFDILMTQVAMTYFKNDSKTPIPVHIKIDDLQALTNKFMDENSKPTFRDTNITLDFEKTDAEIIIKDKHYIFTVLYILSRTPLDIIEFYLWWTTVTTLAPYTSTYLRTYTAEFLYILKETEAKPRDLYCAEAVNTLLGMATAYSLINDTSIKENMQKVSQMVENIQLAFRRNIKNLVWMDQKTKQATIEKISKMKTCIGYPPWLEIPSEVDNYYEEYMNVDIANEDFLTNILNLTQIRNQANLAIYREEVDIEEEMWIFSPLDVNAYNWLEGNRINIPAGILQFPFYDQGLQALNYGSIGSIIGHELTHGFDNTGKEYDHTGLANSWWTNETMTEFDNRMQCFIDHYDHFQILKENLTEEEPHDEDSEIAMTNGMRTLDENIADNGGIRHALHAYRNYIQQHGAEPLLAEFKEYTAEHLFFLSFANTWCENKNERGYSRDTDEHSPNRVRVWGTLTNSKEFANTWKCKQGTTMNPNKVKCEMW